MIFRRVAILTLAWVLVGFGIDFDAKSPTQAGQVERPVVRIVPPIDELDFSRSMQPN